MLVNGKSLGAILTHSPGTTVGVILVSLHLLNALFAPLLIPYGETQLVGQPMLEPGHANFLLGTDVIGRDFLSRLMMGGRTSITVAMVGVLGAVLIGTFFAVSAAYIGGFYDDVIMRIVDTKLSIPGILFVALFVVGFGRSVTVLTIVIGLSYFPGAVRTIRSQAMTQVPLAYVKAARLRGESTLSVIFRELTPNVVEVVVVEFAIRTSSAILIVSALSFLGLGISPPTPDWGLMVSEGVNQIYQAPWLILFPAVFISTLVVGLNFASDGLANALGLDAARGLHGG
ncbi:MAG: ABC transporter permease [Rhodospirillaceae bacterium]|jgi:peptide/nickel transport system permease protein|nr:ABC transporter permease [Rhodospirillaceae bacterium]MBT3908829.1 ABC transporter permease [Rhodospirillaceae bacterium]MBT5297119.1 ABC transporter permease [Rhodospirillaceae bacterium]MBT5512873.1 ABC transporter permease [Rhodospirillaceae bacterium]MBT6086442.1 ABC transporter permease [Rhodospirillaceae bacterium]